MVFETVCLPMYLKKNRRTLEMRFTSLMVNIQEVRIFFFSEDSKFVRKEPNKDKSLIEDDFQMVLKVIIDTERIFIVD